MKTLCTVCGEDNIIQLYAKVGPILPKDERYFCFNCDKARNAMFGEKSNSEIMAMREDNE